MKKKLIRLKRINFIELARQPFSYNVFKNRHIWLGFLIGLPVPLLCFISNPGGCIDNPVHWLLFTVPFIIAFLFGCWGTFRVWLESQAESYKLLYRIKAKGQI